MNDAKRLVFRIKFINISDVYITAGVFGYLRVIAWLQMDEHFVLTQN